MDKVSGLSAKPHAKIESIITSDESSVTQSGARAKPTLIETQRSRIGLVLSNRELKKRQLEDKYEGESDVQGAAALSGLLNKTMEHSCVHRRKERSSSLSCVDCLSLQESSVFTKAKGTKKRNSLFGPKHAEDLLSALPRYCFYWLVRGKWNG